METHHHNTHHLETATPRPIIRRIDWYKVAGLAITVFCAVAFYGGVYLMVTS